METAREFRKLRPPLRPGLAILGVAATLTLAAAGPRILRPARANPSDLLNTVKNNPAMGKQLCQQFKDINGNGHSVYSSAGLEQVAASQGISIGDAEIFVTYAVGLYCSGVP